MAEQTQAIQKEIEDAKRRRQALINEVRCLHTDAGNKGSTQRRIEESEKIIEREQRNLDRLRDALRNAPQRIDELREAVIRVNKQIFKLENRAKLEKLADLQREYERAEQSEPVTETEAKAVSTPSLKFSIPTIPRPSSTGTTVRSAADG